MDVWTVLTACVRRWYVFVPTLLVALAFAYTQMQAMPPAYLATSSATVVGPALVPGQDPGEVIEVNPFESLGGSLNATGQVLTSMMDSDPKRTQFADAGVTAGYEVSQDDAVIYFDVTGEDADEVVTSATRLVELLDSELAALQERPVEAPESRVRAVALTVPTIADEDPVAGLRTFVVFAAIGLILAVGLALVADAVLRSRRRRADANDDGAHDDGARDDDETDGGTTAAGTFPPVVQPTRRNRRSGGATADPRVGSEDVTQPLVLPEMDHGAHAGDQADGQPEGRHVDAPDSEDHAADLSPVGQAPRHTPGV